ncbi:MAG TPA: hypothetical protein VH111_12385 [Steroidobacteraceae bacterium]|nr:hypothetical protein [Steroidobacteraceae bacterium]
MSDDNRAPDTRKVSSLGELSPAIEPPRDLWPQIEGQISAERRPQVATVRADRGQRRALMWRSLAAAAMVASVAVGVWIGRSVLPVPLSAGSRPEAGQLIGSAAAFEAAYVSDPRYQRDRKALLRGLEARLAELPPASREKVVKSLTDIRRAKEDLESALGKDPSNALLQELLVNTCQDEMRVLTDLRQASDAGAGI